MQKCIKTHFILCLGHLAVRVIITLINRLRPIAFLLCGYRRQVALLLLAWNDACNLHRNAAGITAPTVIRSQYPRLIACFVYYV